MHAPSYFTVHFIQEFRNDSILRKNNRWQEVESTGNRPAAINKSFVLTNYPVAVLGWQDFDAIYGTFGTDS